MREINQAIMRLWIKKPPRDIDNPPKLANSYSPKLEWSIVLNAQNKGTKGGWEGKKENTFTQQFIFIQSKCN